MEERRRRGCARRLERANGINYGQMMANSGSHVRFSLITCEWVEELLWTGGGVDWSGREGERERDSV